MYSVLYVDDEPGLLEITKLFLERTGDFAVDTRTSAKDAFSELECRPYDAIISDYQMPGMNGLVFLRNVRSQYGDIPFILFTGKGREEVVIEAINNGVDFYLQKGGEPTGMFAELAHKIRRAIERRSVGKALHESEERLRFALEGANEGLWDMDLTTGALFMNPHSCEILGYPSGDLQESADAWRELVADEDLPATRTAFAEYVSGKTPMFQIEQRFRTKSGGRKWVNARGRIVERDLRGNPLRITGTLTDISERKKAEEELRHLKISVDVGSDEVFWLDFEGKILNVNESACRATGYSREELVGMKIFSLDPDFDPSRYAESIADLRLRKTQTFETRHQRKDGTLMNVEVVANYVAEQGEEYSFAFARDITDRKHAEYDLQLAKKDWETIFRAIGSPAIIMDPCHRIIEANEEVVRISGKTLEELKTLHCWDIFHLNTTGSPVPGCPMEKMIESGTAETVVMEIDALGGIYLVSCTPVFDECGNLQKIIHIATDISESKRMEAVLAENRDYLNQIFTSVKEGILIIDARSHEILDANPAALRLIGAESGKVIGKVCHDYICPAENGQCPITDRHQTVDNSERTLITAKGKQVPIIKNVVPFRFRGRSCLLETFFDNTKRKKAEDELRAAYEQLTASEEELREQYDALSRNEVIIRDSEEKYRLLTEQTPDIIYKVDLQGRILHASPQVARYGFDPQKLISRNIAQFIVEEDVARVFEYVEKIISMLQPGVFTFRILDENGCIHWMEANGTPVFDKSGSIVALSGALRDITEKKQAEDALAQSEERLRLTFDATDEGLWDWNLATGTTFFSPRFYTMLGYDPGDFSPSYENSLRLIHPDDAGAATQEINDHIRYKPEGYSVEFRMKTKSGEWAWILSRGKVVERDAEDRPVRMVGTHTDITHQRKSQDELRAAYEQLTASEEELREQFDELNRNEDAIRLSEEQFRRTFDQSPVGAAITSLDLRYIRVNASLCKFLGYREEELLGRSFKDITPPDDIAGDLDNIRRLSTGELEEYRTEKRYIRKDGRFVWARLSSRMVRDSAGKPLHYIPIMVDITAEKESRDAIQRQDALLVAINFAAERLIEVRRWSDCIGGILEKFGGAAGVDRVFIFEFTARKDGTPLANLRFERVAPGVQPLIGDSRLQEIPYLELGLGPVYTDLQVKNFFAGDIDGLPKPAKALFEGSRIHSLLMVPIMVDNVPWGFTGFNNASGIDRTYQPVEIEALQTVAGIIGSAIARTRYEDELHRSLETGEVLLREVHHRVRNNMQVISSLLSIESGNITDKRVLVYFRETESRIKSMALVHEKLYKSDSLSTINVADYVHSLVADLISTYAIRAIVSVQETFDDDVTVELERAIPFGLIVHEIVTNSLTHAFPDRNTGILSIVAKKVSEKNFSLKIRDDGVGIPEDIDFDHAGTLGMQLISMLSRQVDGTICFSRDSGTEFVLTLPCYCGVMPADKN
jgi:PAS domain S-box-containing protein